jgi:hypothetical protein
MPKILLRNITKKFEKVVALNNLSVKINDGEFFVIIGPSGAGKTTLLKVIAGLENPENGEIYFDVFIIAVFVFGLTYFLGRIQKLSDNLKDYKYPVVLKVLFVSIIMPLVSVYTVVLYAYLIRIILTMTWPQGIVSNLVTWYGFISIILLILIEPLIPSSSWVAKFRKFLPIAILIPFIMLIISIMIRINAYGITILRYLVVAAWVWLLFSALFLITFFLNN